MQEALPITHLLSAWRAGDEQALAELMPLVYGELKRLARGVFNGERGGHTLQPTAIVHEAFGRLAEADVSWQDRSHFFALSARIMRRVLLDHARARNAEKRGGVLKRVTWQESDAGGDGIDLQILDLNDALEALAVLSLRKAEVVELQLFGGLTIAEIAEVTGQSESGVERDLRFARSWLAARLGAG